MFNEMYQSESVIRNHYNNINDWLDQMTSKVILEKNAEAETHFRNIGITSVSYTHLTLPTIYSV